MTLVALAPDVSLKSEQELRRLERKRRLLNIPVYREPLVEISGNAGNVASSCGLHESDY